MNKYNIAKTAVKYWQSVEEGTELNVLTKHVNAVKWESIGIDEIPLFQPNFNYKVVAPCNTELCLKHLNEGIHIEVMIHSKWTSIDVKSPSQQDDLWESSRCMFREKPLYKDNEVWWCNKGFGVHSPLFYLQGSWYISDGSSGQVTQDGNFKPLYKIGDLK